MAPFEIEGSRRRHPSPAYREGLAVILGWDRQPTRAEENAARWDRRLAALVRYRQDGND